MSADYDNFHDCLNRRQWIESHCSGFAILILERVLWLQHYLDRRVSLILIDNNFTACINFNFIFAVALSKASKALARGGQQVAKCKLLNVVIVQYKNRLRESLLKTSEYIKRLHT